MTHVYQPHAGGFAYFTSGVINGAIGVGGTWTAYSTLTLPAYTLGGTVTSNGQSFSGTIANLGTVTTVDLNGGTIDGAIIGGAVPAAGTFTTAAATTGNITTVNATTVDTTNIEVTNLKAKDGTAAGSIADATGVVTLASSVLTTTDINAGTIDGTTQASGTINGPIAAGGTWTAAAAWTLPAFTLGGTVTSNGQSFSGTIANLGTVTTVDINGGTWQGTIDGNWTAASQTCADLGTVTTADINGGTIDGVALGGASAVSLGTPSSGTLTNCTGLPVSTGISGLAANVATFLATPSSANLASAVTDETGSGALVFATSPSFTTPTINTAASVGGSWTAAAAWTLPAFTLGGTVTSNGQSFSGTIANLGTVTTADINGGTIDGAVIGATTPAAGTFTNGSFTGTLAVDGSVWLGNASTDTLNVGNGGIIKDASGNVGIGVTPSAWVGAVPTAMQVKQAAIGANSDGVQSYFASNLYFDGAAWRYINTGQGAIAGLTTQTSTGGHTWWGVASGTAGNAATLVELGRLTSVGLGIGVTPSYKLATATGLTWAAQVASNNAAEVHKVGIRAPTDGASDSRADIRFGTTVGSGGSDSYIAFWTNTYGVAYAERMLIDKSGNVGIGVTPSYKLHVGSGQIAAPDGSAAAPAYTFASSGNSDTGAYLSAADTFAIASAGHLAASVVHVANNYTKFTVRNATAGITGYAEVELIANSATGRVKLRDSSHSSAPGTLELTPGSGGSVFIGAGSAATSATNGFVYIPTCAGTPTGTPTTATGLAPLIVDTTNNKLYFYSGGSWRDAGP